MRQETEKLAVREPLTESNSVSCKVLLVWAPREARSGTTSGFGIREIGSESAILLVWNVIRLLAPFPHGGPGEALLGEWGEETDYISDYSSLETDKISGSSRFW